MGSTGLAGCYKPFAMYVFNRSPNYVGSHPKAVISVAVWSVQLGQRSMLLATRNRGKTKCTVTWEGQHGGVAF